MNRSILQSLTAIAVAALGIVSTEAASITWNAPVTFAGDPDVSTNGHGLFAYNWANSNRTVNGVTFTDTAATTTVGTNLTLTSWDVLKTGTLGASPVNCTNTTTTNNLQFYIIKSP